MNKATLFTLPCLVGTLLAPALAGAEDFLLYTPKPSEEAQPPASPQDGVLVRKITIKRGDTLSELSKKYIGRSSWYPEMLVFNSIRNPNLIYEGKELLVPVPPQQGEHKEPKAKRHAGKQAQHAKVAPQPQASHKELPKTQPAPPKAAKPAAKKAEHVQPPRPVSQDEMGSYRQAKLVYLNGDYRQSLALFNEFLDKYPNSALAADAALYRADSMLHLSGE